MRFTFNDFVMSVMTLTLREFIKTERTVQLNVPFTLRNFPEETEIDMDGNFPITNDFAAVPIILDLC